MESTLKYILYAIALAVAITGFNVLFGGASAITGSTGVAETTVDNELRFFSVFWLAYGAFFFGSLEIFRHNINLFHSLH
jgi:hypothetical protein